MTTRVKESETTREEEVNVHLALALSRRRISAKAERRSWQGVPDVRVALRSGLVLLECKWEGSEKPLGDQLQERRADFPEALAMLGVLYPERLRHAEDTLAELESAEDLQWWLDHAHGASPPGLGVKRRGSVADLADQLRILPLELEGVDRVQAAAEAVGYALEQAAKPLAQHQRLARRIADIIASTDQEKNRAAALRIGCLVLFNALAFQDRLSAANDNVPMVEEALQKGIPGLRAAWLAICNDIDYVPVFELAAELLAVLEDGPEDVRQPVIDPLVKAVDDTRRVEGHDLSGRLFHTLLTDAKFTGAYYTSVPAATLLARLVFHNWPAGVDWSDHEFPASLNVADLACGTGTLLLAVATEAERRHRDAGGRNAPALHKAMVEQALHGYDVQLSAVHFAATSLAMLNPEIQFDRMNLYVMSLGADGERVSLGSLDFLGTSEAPVQYALSPEGGWAASGDVAQVTGGGSRGVAEGAKATLPQLDLAIMNPPFTRSVGGNLLFGSLPAVGKAQTPGRTVTPPEVAASIRHCRSWRRVRCSRRPQAGTRRGALGAGASANRLYRSLVGADPCPHRASTSPSTSSSRPTTPSVGTSRIVRISRKPCSLPRAAPANLPKADSRTTFVNLWRNPDGVVDAHRVAQAVTATTPANLEETGTALLEVDGLHVGEVVSISEDQSSLNKQWVGVQFARADMTRSAVRLLDDGEVWIPGGETTASIPLCKLGALGQIGPDVRDVRDGFEPTDAITAYPMVEGNDTEKRKRLSVEPDKYLGSAHTATTGPTPQAT